MGVRPNLPWLLPAVSSVIFFVITLFFALNQTMDTLASIVFAEIIIMALVYKGYRQVRDQVKLASLAGVIAATGLGLVYGGLMYLITTCAARHIEPGLGD